MARTRMRFPDPYDQMTDAEFTAYVERMRGGRGRQVPVSLRMPVEMLRELKAEAEQLGIPYQTYLKAIVANRRRLPRAS
jgi:predicted DNA binding CopG/RHH family protein